MVRRLVPVVLTSDQRVSAADGARYVYPDVSVVCGEITTAAGTTDVLANPCVLVEVLSSTTEQHDRGRKWDGYQRIASLTDYVLVSQVEPRVEHFRRDREADTWVYRSARSGERVVLSNGLEMEVDALFVSVMALPGD